MPRPRLPPGTKPLVHVAVCLLGVASWVDINGLWVELPALVTRLPEAWNLPSYAIIISQVANVGPLLFALVTFLKQDLRPERAVSYVIIGVGCVACVLLAFLWERTAVIGGVERSLALLSLVSALALVDCTSSLAFLAFMASLKPAYMQTYFIGEGLSGLVPSFLALAQGAGEIVCVNSTDVNATTAQNGTWHNVTTWQTYPSYREPRFSVRVFFLLLAGLLVLSFLALLFLHLHRSCRDQFHVVGRDMLYGSTCGVHDTAISKSGSASGGGVKNPVFLDPKQSPASSSNNEPAQRKFSELAVDGDGGNARVEQETKVVVISPGRMVFLLALVTWINMLITSFLLSIQTYSTLPYSIETYHLAATLANVANPAACLLSLFLPTLSTAVILAVTVLGTVCAAYIVTVAAMSPLVPLSSHPQGGGALVVLAWVAASFLLTYGKISVAGVLRLDQTDGRRKLVWVGVFTQVGALVGAVTSFVMVNTFRLFHDAPLC